jgi:hypothetical protein
MANIRDVQIRVDENSRVARLTAWHAGGRSRPLSGFGREGHRPHLFIANEVLVHASEKDLVEEIVRLYGATVIPNAPLPPVPAGLPIRPRHDLPEMPLPVRLSFTNPPNIDNAVSRIQRAAETHGGLEGDVAVTSSHAAAMIALVAEYAVAGRKIGLNVVGVTEQLPLETAQEWFQHPAGGDPFQWACYAGKSRVVEAWQLVESCRRMQAKPSIPTIYIGILDGGFWLDGAGKPFVAPGQSVSDFGAGVLQVNMMNPSPAGGANPSKCSKDSYCPWHGNGVAGIAAAAVGNGAGAAGSGGTVGLAAMFKSDFSLDQIYSCLHTCAAWSIPVLNMSFSIGTWDIVFPTGTWNDAFQFAADNGVIVVVAAGNDGANLPDDLDVRPATRTPSTITVGNLAQDNTAAPDSNYGSSVDIWAPGTGIPIVPDPDNPNGSIANGTSEASPLVAGVVAMLRYLDSTISPARAKQILTQTAWPGTGRVTRGLDAFAAVFLAMGNTLPDTSEPNDNAAQAVELVPLSAGGPLGPPYTGFSSLAHPGDEDWWFFRTGSYMNATVTFEWYSPLTEARVEILPDDPDSRVPSEIEESDSPGVVIIYLTDNA